MGSKEVVETIYGKYHKFEIIKETSLMGSPKFHIYRDGSYFKSYSSLADAVAAAQAQG
jgi:hypothetical protein